VVSPLLRIKEVVEVAGLSLLLEQLKLTIKLSMASLETCLNNSWLIVLRTLTIMVAMEVYLLMPLSIFSTTMA